MTKIFYIVAGLIAVAIALGIYTFIEKPNANGNKPVNQTLNNAAGATTNFVNTVTGGTVGSSKFPLHNGSRGEEVSKLQTYLNYTLKLGHKLAVDGNFGALTEQALINKTGIATMDETTYNNTVLPAIAAHTIQTGTGAHSATPR